MEKIYTERLDRIYKGKNGFTRDLATRYLLQHKYGEKNKLIQRRLSKECLIEMFLLGAVLESYDIAGLTYEVVVLDDAIYYWMKD